MLRNFGAGGVSTRKGAQLFRQNGQFSDWRLVGARLESLHCLAACQAYTDVLRSRSRRSPETLPSNGLASGQIYNRSETLLGEQTECRAMDTRFVRNGHGLIHSRDFSTWAKVKDELKKQLEKDKELREQLKELKKSAESVGQQMDEMAKKSQEVGKQAAGAAGKAKSNLDEWSTKAKEGTEKMKEEMDKKAGEMKSTWGENLKSSWQEKSEKMKDAYEGVQGKVKERTEKAKEDSLFIQRVWQKVSDGASMAGAAYKKVAEGEMTKKLKEDIKLGWAELLGKDKKKGSALRMRVKSAPKPVQKQDEDGESEEAAMPEEEVPAGGALVVVKGDETAWERIGRRLKDTPIIQGILGAARQAAQTEAGKTIGKGAKKAKDKFGDAAEDAREYWETSQNPWVYRVSSVYDGLFGETEMGMAIREIRRTDPSFVIEEWKEEIAETAIPDILGAYLQGDGTKLRQWCGEAAYNQVSAAIRERKQEGLVVDPHILAIRNVEVLAAKVQEKTSPIIVVQFMAQQINCIRNREGEVVEGAEDDIRAVHYALAFQRDWDEDEGVLEWRVIEFMLVGAVPWV